MQRLRRMAFKLLSEMQRLRRMCFKLLSEMQRLRRMPFKLLRKPNSRDRAVLLYCSTAHFCILKDQGNDKRRYLG